MLSAQTMTVHTLIIDTYNHSTCTTAVLLVAYTVILLACCPDTTMTVHTPIIDAYHVASCIQLSSYITIFPFIP
jgi:hypothetical protein